MLKEFRKPDLNAPRCRSYPTRIVDKDFLKDLAEICPDTKGMNILDVNKVLGTIHGKMWEHAAHHRDGIELFEQLGYVFVGTCKPPKKFNVDYGESIKTGLTVRHRNFDTDSHLAKIFYTNFALKYKFKNRKMWKFDATRAFQRTIPKVYPEKWKQFVQVEDGRAISRYVSQSRKTDYIKKKAELPVDENYDEFNLD